MVSRGVGILNLWNPLNPCNPCRRKFLFKNEIDNYCRSCCNVSNNGAHRQPSHESSKKSCKKSSSSSSEEISEDGERRKRSNDDDDIMKKAQQLIESQQMIVKERWEKIKDSLTPSSSNSTHNNNEWYYKKVNFWMKRYENFVGLTEVKSAQAKVVEAEKRFIDSQEIRRETQVQISEIQRKIKEIHTELEKTHRGEDRYLILVTQEHNVIKEERTLLETFKLLEKSERDYFSALSNAVRDSHEKERAQAEKTKYWSVLGSIIGTCLGILGTTINNRMRMNELRRLVSDNSGGKVLHSIADEIAMEITKSERALNNLANRIESVVGGLNTGLAQVGSLEPALNSLSNVYNIQDLISNSDKSIVELSKIVDDNYKDLRKEFKSDLQSIVTSLQRKLIDMVEIQKNRETAFNNSIIKKVEKIQNSNKETFEALNDLDERVKDIRSLLLAQNITANSTQISKTINYDTATIKDMLKEQENKRIQTIYFLGTGIACAIAVYVLRNIV